MRGNLLQQQLYACWDEWPPIPNLTGISPVRGEGQVKDSVLQMLGPLVFGECMASSGNELGWGMGAYRFLGVDLKPEGPSLCSHGLTNSLGQPTVPTHVGVCMSVCVCTVCAYMSLCVYVHSGGMYACIHFTLCRCVWVHMSAFVHAWLCACEGMGAVCRWGSSEPSPRHKSPQTHSWVRKH